MKKTLKSKLWAFTVSRSWSDFGVTIFAIIVAIIGTVQIVIRIARMINSSFEG